MARGEQEQQCFDIVRDKLEKYQYSSTLSEKELNAIRYIFQTSIPNPNSSEFPDFIFENGFIEHFQVTSAKETKKGAKVAEAITYFEKDCELADEEMSKTLTLPHEVNQFYTHVISCDAYNFLKEKGINGRYGEIVDYIRNQDGSGQCPLETYIDGYVGTDSILPRIAEFVASMK